MLAAMFAVGAIAVAAPEATGERAWLFADGQRGSGSCCSASGSRVVGQRRASRTRLLVYNGATAVLWFVSIWLPIPCCSD